MTSVPVVSVVVVSWDGLNHLERCLPSLMSSLELLPGDAEVLVVDNGSVDGTADYLTVNYPSVRVMRNEANMGFGVANNQAFGEARGHFVATLNNDTVVDERWLVELLAVMESDPSLGSAAAQMRFLNHPGVINSAGIMVNLAGRGFDRLYGEPVETSEAAPVPVFGACAGAALYRSEMLTGLGGFDDSYFAYDEDVDLAWRARRAGWRCMYVPSAVVLHGWSMTAKRVPRLKAYLVARNRLWTLAKNASPRQLRLQLPRIVVDEVAHMVWFLARDRSTADLRGRLAAMRGLPRVCRQRRTLPFLDLEEFADTGPLFGMLGRRLRRDRLLGPAPQGHPRTPGTGSAAS